MLREIRVQVGRTGVLTPLAEFDPVVVAGLDDRARHAAQRRRGASQGRARRRHDRRAQGRRRDPRGRRSGAAAAPRRREREWRCPTLSELRQRRLARAGRGRCRAAPTSRCPGAAPRASRPLGGRAARSTSTAWATRSSPGSSRPGCSHDVADFYTLTVRAARGARHGPREEGRLADPAGRDRRREAHGEHRGVARPRPLARLLFGLGIRHVGATVAEALAAAFGCSTRSSAAASSRRSRRGLSIAAALAADPLATSRVGPKIARVVRAFFANPDNVADHRAAARRRRRARRGAPRARAPADAGRARRSCSPARSSATRATRPARRSRRSARRSPGSVSKKTSFVVAGRGRRQQVRQGARARRARARRGRAHRHA